MIRPPPISPLFPYPPLFRSRPSPPYRQPLLEESLPMTAQRLVVALTALNIALVASTFLSRTRPAVAASEVASVLRGRALEIVDDRGRVRASIAVLPADPAFKMPDGTTGYPETVLLRLRTSAGRPNVKLAATEDGAGLVLGGDSDPTYAQLLARGDSTFLKLSNKNGHVHLVE